MVEIVSYRTRDLLVLTMREFIKAVRKAIFIYFDIYPPKFTVLKILKMVLSVHTEETTNPKNGLLIGAIAHLWTCN